MKAAIGNLCYFFNTHRMVREYTERFYLPAAKHHAQFTAEGIARAKALAAWKAKVQGSWADVTVVAVASSSATELQVGQQAKGQAQVKLENLAPEDVLVELYAGLVDAHGEIAQPEIIAMQALAERQGENFIFAATTAPHHSGLHGYTVRIRPRHPDLATEFIPGLIVWAVLEKAIAA